MALSPPSDAVWRALGDGTRRGILDLLRSGPRTTGAVASEFPISRIAVMRHLDTLAGAGLVTSRKRGRERWHYLNVTSLVDLGGRWTAPGAERIARGLTQLDERLAGRPAIGAEIDIALDVLFRSSREKVFAAIVDEPGAWWGHPYLHPQATGLAIDAALGGHFVEAWRDGGAILATVVAVRPGHHLRLSGQFHLGAATGVANVELDDSGSGSLLRFAFQAYGAVEPEIAEQFQGGWRELIETRLPAYVDDGRRLGVDGGHVDSAPEA